VVLAFLQEVEVLLLGGSQFESVRLDEYRSWHGRVYRWSGR